MVSVMVATAGHDPAGVGAGAGVICAGETGVEAGGAGVQVGTEMG